MARWIVAAAAALALGACATGRLGEDDCLAGDFGSVGFADGRAGALAAKVEDRVAECARFGVAVDRAAYAAGREDGLRRLCTVEGGEAFGLDDKRYQGVCPGDAENDFLAGYVVGRWLREFLDDVRSAQNGYDFDVDRIENARLAIRKARRVLRDDDASEDDREQARKDIERERDRLDGALFSADLSFDRLVQAEAAYDVASATRETYRDSEVARDVRGSLHEAHTVARAVEGFGPCADGRRIVLADCDVAPGTEIVAGVVDGARDLCLVGPGLARAYARGPIALAGGVAGRYQAFDFYPRDAESGRLARTPTAGFEALFLASDGAYSDGAYSDRAGGAAAFDGFNCVPPRDVRR